MAKASDIDLVFQVVNSEDNKKMSSTLDDSMVNCSPSQDHDCLRRDW
jgi:hypothetical protein